MPGGRPIHDIWVYFGKIFAEGKSRPVKAKCNKCSESISARPDRMRSHYARHEAADRMRSHYARHEAAENLQTEAVSACT